MENPLGRASPQGSVLIRAVIRRWFPWLQIIWLIIWSPFLLFISSTNWWWLLSIPMLWIIAWWARGYALPRTPLNISIGLIGGMTGLSLLITPDMTLSLPKAAGLFLGLTLFYAMLDLGSSSKRIEIIAGALILIGFGLSVVGLFGTQWLDKSSIFASITAVFPQVIRGLPGATEGFHPNEVAGTLLWVAPLALILSIGILKKQSRGLGIAIGSAGLWILAFISISQSRSAWFGLVIAVVVMIAIVNRAARWVLATFVVVGVVCVVLLGPDRIGAAIFGTTVDTSPENQVIQPIGSLNWNFRMEVWKVATQGIADFPFTGMGIGTFREIGRIFYPLTIPPSYDFAHAHNEFLQAALDLGLPGLIAFCALYVGAFWMLREVWRTTSAGMVHYLGLGLGGGLFAHLIYGLTDAVALGAKPGILFWMLLGLITGLFQQQQLNPRGIDQATLAEKK